MKPLPSPAQGLSLAQYRHKQLVAACGPVWLFSAGIHAGAVLKHVLNLVHRQNSLIATVLELANTATHFGGHTLPLWTARLHGPDKIQAACITAHVTNSVLLWLMALGFILFPTDTRGFLESQFELVLEIFLTYQYQLSLPVMAILHAFRQTSWMSVIFWRMEGDLHRLLVRGTGNWCLMMLLSTFLEIRLRAAYQRACGVMGQQQQPQKQLEQEPETSCAHLHMLEGTSDSASDLLSIVKPQPQGCVDAVSKPGADCRRRRLSIKHELEDSVEGQVTDSEAPADATVTLGGSLAGALADKTSLPPQLMPGEAGVQLPVAPVPALAKEASGMKLLAEVQQAKLAPHRQLAAQALLQSVKGLPVAPYKRCRHGKANTVHVKVEGIELEHLPADLPELLQKQLSYCMPGVTMTGLALRSGCVMMTLDLEEGGTVALSADGMRDLVTRLMQGQAMGQVLEDGPPLCIQMPDELALCRWDSASGSYMSEGAPALDSSDWYSCRMVSAGPAVHCLSGNSADTSALIGNQLTLTVELELPSNCQLHGWQPDGAAAAAGSGGLLQDWPKDGPALDAMLLARQLGGGYLPVVVQQVPHAGKSSRDTTTHQVTAQVIVSVAGEGPAALHLELWCKQADAAGRAVGEMEIQAAWVPGHMPGLELQVSCMPLLVLPGSWKEAVAELLQHIDDIGGVQPEYALAHMAGTTASGRLSMKKLPYQDPGLDTGTGQPNRGQKVNDSVSSHVSARIHPSFIAADDDPACCLLEDLGALLTHQPTAGNTLAAVPGSVMSQLGDDLLVYAVQHGLASVASVIVDTMQRIEQRRAASTAARPAVISPSAWLLRVAGCASYSDSDGLPGGNGGRTSLLHAAMASGSTEMLGHVFRWGTLYGGPDWAWPWELEDATGCTALHLAAAQPAAGASAALLKTTTCMLPAAQVQAARNAWLHSQGGLRTTPVQLCALASNGGCVGDMWGDATNTQPGSATESAGAGSSTASSSDSPQATAALTVQPPSTQAQSWLGSMVEVWTSREPEEYHAWAKRQDSLSIWYWAAALFMMAANAMRVSAVAGCLQYEWLYMTLYSWFMIPAVIATAGGNEWLGSSKVWIVLAQVMPICSWVVRIPLLQHQAPVWVSAANTGADVIYVLLMAVAIDKIPMHQLVLSRAIEALVQSYAYRKFGFAHPLLRALAVHSSAVVVSTVARTRKLRAFYRWQAIKKQAIKKQA